MADRSKSEAIRRVLEAVPDIKAAHAREILAKEEGIEISLDLFRVVKKNWLRDRREQEEARRKYEEYWSAEAVYGRLKEEQEYNRRVEEEDPSLWWEYWDWKDNPIGEPPEQPDFCPTMDIYDGYHRRSVDEHRANPLQKSDEGSLPDPVPASTEPRGPGDGQSPALTAGVKEPIEERKCLTAQQKDDLVAEVVRQFTAEEWAEITDEYPRPEFARRAILADLLQDIAHGWTPEEAVTRVVAEFRSNHA